MGLDEMVNAKTPKFGAHAEKVAPVEVDEFEGRPEDAFRTRKGSHCLLVYASDGTVQWFPYPAMDRGIMNVRRDEITLTFTAGIVTIRGNNLLPLVLALADYRAASVRVAEESKGCKTAITAIEIE